MLADRRAVISKPKTFPTLEAPSVSNPRCHLRDVVARHAGLL